VVRQAMDKMEQAPGFFEIDLVAHCGHSLKGEHAWTLTATDVYLGWTVNIAIRNRAYSRVVAAIEEVTDRLPYPMVGLDCDNGGEFINHALIAWCAERTIFMTRARAHTSNDNAHVEQKNGDIVRKSAFRYRYDTPEELALLNELWGHVNRRKNLFLATKKANGWRATKAGRSTRTYDKPKTPYQRLREEARLPGRRRRTPTTAALRPDQPGRPDPQHQPDPASPHRLRQGQDPHPEGPGFVSKLGEAREARFASTLT